MQIAMYSNHLFLPFGSDPKQPKLLFDPDVMSGLKHKAKYKLTMEKSFIWPILIGIYSIPSQFLAHISIGVRLSEKTYVFPDFVLVQITTFPTECTPKKKLPLVVVHGVTQVQSIWRSSKKQHISFQYSKKEYAGDGTTEFWKDFFIKKITEQ